MNPTKPDSGAEVKMNAHAAAGQRAGGGSRCGVDQVRRR